MLRIDDDGAYESWCLSAGGTLRNGIPSTQQGRISFLVNDLLCRTDWVTLDSLASSLFCSRRTVASALGGVASYLEMFRPRARAPSASRHTRLQLRGQAPHAWRTSSSTAWRPTAASTPRYPASAPAIDPRPSPIGTTAWRPSPRAWTPPPRSTASRSTRSVSQNLLVHIAVAVVRVRAHHYVSGVVEEARSLVGSAAWRVAASITERVGEALDVELPDSEIAYIAIHLAGKRVLFPVEPHRRARVPRSRRNRRHRATAPRPSRPRRCPRSPGVRRPDDPGGRPRVQPRPR